MGTERAINLYNEFTDEFTDHSIAYKIPIATLLAILHVESNGQGFTPSTGSMIIRCELHKFVKYCGNTAIEKAKTQIRFNTNKPWTEQKFRSWNEDTFMSFHGNQTKEHSVFGQLQDIDERAAYMCISMGAPQIMGMHYQMLQFNSPQGMYGYMHIGIMEQIEVMFRFLHSDMIKNLRERNFTGFAASYNGKGQAVRYGEMIRVAEEEIAAELDY